MESVEVEIVRAADVTRMTGLSRVTLWRRVRDGDFPKPLRLGGPGSRSIGWRIGDVRHWVDGLVPKQHGEAERRG